MIPLGIAMKIQVQMFIANQLFSVLKSVPASVTITIFALQCLYGFVSNNATAIIIAPIVIAVAAKLNLNQNHLLYAACVWTNFSFYIYGI
jgi:di/tricarboxylate transporter